MSDPLRPHGRRGPHGSSVHGDSSDKNTAVGYHALLQGIFPTQGSNPPLLCLLHWQVSSLPLSHQGVKVYFSPVFYQGDYLWSGSFLCGKIQELGSFHFVNYIVCPPLSRSLESSLFS